jgi:hypothetical protein
MNSILPIKQVITVATLHGGPLIAGQANALNLSSGVPGVALDGAMLYANNAAGERVGSFVDLSGTFKAFPGCGKNEHGKMAGVIHQKLISCFVCPVHVPTSLILPLLPIKWKGENRIEFASKWKC